MVVNEMDEKDKKLLLDFLSESRGKCPQNDTVPKNFCGAIFDGLICWPTTQADENVTLPCPNNEYIKSKFSVSTKIFVPVLKRKKIFQKFRSNKDFVFIIFL